MEQEQEQQFSLDLQRWFGALRRWYRLIILTALLVGGTALLVSLVMPPTYEAEATVAIVKTVSTVSFDPKFKTVSELDSSASVDQAARRKSLTTLVKSPDIASAVIAKVGQQFFETPPDPMVLAAGLDVVLDGDLIRIRATGKTPERAALLANTWAREYEQRINSVYGENTLSSSDFGSQANTAKKDYDAKEAALIAYLATNPTDKLARQITEKQQILAALQSGKDTAIKTVVKKELEARLDAVVSSRLAPFSQQSEARIQKLADSYTIANKLDRLTADAEALRARVASGASNSVRGDELASMLLEASAFSTWSSLPVNLQIPIDQLSAGMQAGDQLNSLDALIRTLKDRRKSVQSDIDAQSKEIMSYPGYSFLDVAVSGQDSILEALKKRYPELFAAGSPTATLGSESTQSLLQFAGLEAAIISSAAIEPTSRAVDELQDEVNQLLSLQETETAKKQELVRARDLAWSTYSTLATKVAEVGIAAPGSLVRLATPAVPPMAPSSPKKAANTLTGLAVGLLLGIAVAFGFEYVNTPIYTEAQVNQRLGLPVIGAIPELRPGTKPQGETRSDGNQLQPVGVNLAVLDPRSAATEAFRVLRHNLLGQDSQRQVIAVVSATPAEGKSMVAANLAAVTARAGKQVVLVDADFRRPAQHELFGVGNAGGLSNILNGAVEGWEAHAQPTPVDGLRLVTSGPLPSDPAVLLEAPELKRWFDLLKQTAGVVIVDTPAVLGLADALIVANVADRIVLVVAADSVPERDAVRAKELLATTGVPFAGAVMNRVELMPAAMTHAYYYGKNRQPSGSDQPLAPGQARAAAFADLLDRIVEFIIPRKR